MTEQKLENCPSVIKRFNKKWTLRKEGGCHIWKASTNGKRGYGKMIVNGKLELAHRISYRLFRGEIKEGLVIDHLCENVKCVNPEHLQATTQKTNATRSKGAGADNIKKTQCCHGHTYTQETTVLVKSGGVTRRKCRICERNFKKTGIWRMTNE